MDIEVKRAKIKANFKKAVRGGGGSLYMYALDALIEQYNQYYDDEKHKIEPSSPNYEPNPFYFQYDLEVHLFIHYNDIIAREINIIEDKIADESDEEKIEQLNIRLKFVEEYGTGLPRSEHFWNACSVRWPTKIENGKHKGSFIREPWGEDFIDEICEEEYVFAFGGSGQGKTHRALAFMCVLWDHYIDTQLGGRCRFSTVSEDKMKDSTWPYLQRIYKESQQGVSLYCGRGIISGDFTIARPNDRKGGGSIKGILLPRRNDSSSVDKITGSHGHPVGIYHIDEMQSTPEAPVEASPNFLQNCGIGWITASGNFDLATDTLGKNVQPEYGWDSVNETTHRYKSINMLGIRSGCIHYNNDMSPAFEGDGSKKWGHILPTKKKKESRYPTIQSRRSNAYRRLWIGWKEKEAGGNTVLNKATLRDMGCMSEEANFDTMYPVIHGFSFDSAPTSKDRNILTHFADGIDKKTGRWKIHFYEAVAIEKVENSREYIDKATESILNFANKWKVTSGNGIMDWTNITGLPEELKKRGFHVHCVVYNQSPPDGKTRDKRTLEIPQPVILEATTNKFAHNEADNMISMGAMLLQAFCVNGQVTGLSEKFINPRNSDHSYDEELCTRKFITSNSNTYGERQKLEPKHSKSGQTGFTKTHGFSPDILDTMCQAAIHAAMNRGMIPGYKDGSKVAYRDAQEYQEEENFKREIELNSDDDAANIDTFQYPEQKVDYTFQVEDCLDGY